MGRKKKKTNGKKPEQVLIEALRECKNSKDVLVDTNLVGGLKSLLMASEICVERNSKLEAMDSEFRDRHHLQGR